MNELRGLWHGKSEIGGQWIVGYLRKAIYTSDDVRYSITNTMGAHFIVDPSTLGECVGFRDKNRIPMFEGDVVTYKSTSGKTWTGQIFYSVNKSRFVLEVDGGQMFEIARKYANCYEVIGNIHDNLNAKERTSHERE